ncbi:MAG TPA: hypothetical protein DCE71_07255 [Parachlamydiales bacterium]|nr:hypothetical protein [Parachlamydiales bacterium]
MDSKPYCGSTSSLQNHQMRKKTRLKWTLISIFISICAFVLVIFYPQLYYFSNKVEYKNFQIYYDKKIPDQIYSTLDSVEKLIKKSDYYDPKLKFKIFLRSDPSKYNLLPFQFPDRAIGQTIPGIKNIFVYKYDCETNTSCNRAGHVRSLSSILAHEIVHVLVENRWFFKSKVSYFDKDSLSPFGALWKEEGYAEYIAGDLPIALDEGLKILNSNASPVYTPHFEYFKYWLAIRHLILKKQMTFEEILHTKLQLDDVLEEARQAELDQNK